MVVPPGVRVSPTGVDTLPLSVPPTINARPSLSAATAGAPRATCSDASPTTWTLGPSIRSVSAAASGAPPASKPPTARACPPLSSAPPTRLRGVASGVVTLNASVTGS